MDALSIGQALLGGALIGVGAGLLMLVSGRVAGVSGIMAGVLQSGGAEWRWRALFLGGLVAGGFLATPFLAEPFAISIDRSLPVFAAAGLLVGIGARLGSGCTSGHGVCGVARLAPRSIVSTLTFTLAGAVSVLVVNHLLGGAL